MNKFILDKSCHGMPCVQSGLLSLEQCRIIRRVVLNQDSRSEDYRLKQAVSAFLQGYDETRALHNEGWVMIEFWNGETIDHRAFIDHLNKQLGLS